MLFPLASGGGGGGATGTGARGNRQFSLCEFTINIITFLRGDWLIRCKSYQLVSEIETNPNLADSVDSMKNHA